MDPWAIRAACETLATTNKVVIAGETRGPASVTNDQIDERGARGDQGYRLRAGRVSLADRRRSRCCCIRNRPTSRRASMRCSRAPTRKRAPATRASCSATPANETPDLMPAPIFYAHKILRPLVGSPPLRQGDGAGPGRQEPGHRAIRERQAGRRAARSWSRHQHLVEDMTRTRSRARRALCARGAAGGLDVRRDRLYINPTGNFVIGGPDGDCRPHRPQDHRRYLWRCGPAWRRRLLRQGPDQGRSLGRLCRALSRQERRCRRPRRALHDPARLRDRRRRAAVDLCRHQAPARSTEDKLEKAWTSRWT